jgi:hypothetical protein
MSKYSDDATINATARKAREIEAAEAAAQTIAELKETAKNLGIKLTRDQRTKATILAAIEAKRAEDAAKAKPARSEKKRCTSCGVRPRSSQSPEGQLCIPCLTEAEWENQHSDYGHDAEGPESDDATERNARINGCWICHPELNRASAEYKGRVGTSRLGIRMTVSLRATGREKAEQVASQLKKQVTSDVTIKNVRDGVVLKATVSTGNGAVDHDVMTLVWDANGRFTSNGSKLGKRTIRNASEALRLVGATQAA